jgi:CRP/FNR family transcriptional regulator, cyclic AMP receptor protein
MPGHAEFLELLGDEDRQALEAIATPRSATRGQVLLAQGQVGDKVLVLRSGRVKVVAPSLSGHDIVLNFRGPGALLGDQALVDRSPRAANVVAVEPAEFLVAAASAFRAFLESRPSVAVALLELLSMRLRDSDRRLVQFAAADTLGRVAARLVELCDDHGHARDDGSVGIDLPMTQEDLAGWTGSSLEATVKALRTLRELGWIETARRAIVVHDVEALRQRAG